MPHVASQEARMRLLIFGLGYCAGVLADRVRTGGGTVVGTRRTAGALAFDDDAGVRAEIARATHILSSVPPLFGYRISGQKPRWRSSIR